MVSIGVLLFSWTVFLLYGDKKRFPELFPSAIFSSFLAIFTDILMVKYELWSYTDPPLNSQSIKLSLGFGMYLIVAYLFLQYIPDSFREKIVYTFYWTLFAIVFEFFYLKYGLIKHHMWWTLWMSYLADWIIFVLIYLQYCFYARVKDAAVSEDAI